MGAMVNLSLIVSVTLDLPSLSDDLVLPSEHIFSFFVSSLPSKRKKDLEHHYPKDKERLPADYLETR